MKSNIDLYKKKENLQKNFEIVATELKKASLKIDTELNDDLSVLCEDIRANYDMIKGVHSELNSLKDKCSILDNVEKNTNDLLELKEKSKYHDLICISIPKVQLAYDEFEKKHQDLIKKIDENSEKIKNACNDIEILKEDLLKVGSSIEQVDYSLDLDIMRKDIDELKKSKNIKVELRSQPRTTATPRSKNKV